MSRVVVIGAGLGGLIAATRLARAGIDVTLLAKGLGGLPLSPGVIDVWGYDESAPTTSSNPADTGGRSHGLVPDPLARVQVAPPGHPYAVIGADAVREGLAFVRELCGDLLVGDEQENVLLPTAVGAMRPTCLAQPSMLAGRCVDGARFAIVGLKRLKDFHAALIAGNLARTPLPGGGRVQARPLVVDLPARDGEPDSSALTYARAFDTPGFPLRLAATIRPLLEDGETVGLPAMLGLRPGAWRALEDELGHPVFEIPLPPPSVPGLRLNDALTAAAKAAGVRFVQGSRATTARTENARVLSVVLEETGHPQEFAADAFVLATGGFESGALAVDSYGEVTETLFALPVSSPDAGLGNAGERLKETVRAQFPRGPSGLAGGIPQLRVTAPLPDAQNARDDAPVPVTSPASVDLFTADPNAPQPLFAMGVQVDDNMRPRGEDGAIVYDNLYAVAGILAGAQRWREKSGEGIALGSAVKAADEIARSLA